MMQTRLLILMVLTAYSSVAAAQNPTPKIQWGVPLEYATQVDQVSNTQILPRRQQQLAAESSETPTPQPETTQTEEDVSQTEARLNNEVRVLWDEIEKAEKQQQQKTTDIKVLPIKKNAPEPTKTPTPNNQNNSKTPPKPTNTKTKPAPDIKSEKERIDKLLQDKDSKNNNKDNNKTNTSKIIQNTKDKINEKLNDNNNKDNKTTSKIIQNTKDKTDKNNKKTTSNIATTTTAPVVSLPTITAQPKPVLTRKQVLEEEIAREKAALKSAQMQLTLARKRSNQAQIRKLQAIIRDRELNVQAISRELSR